MMEENIKEIGKMENNTVKENFSNQNKKSGKKVYGAKEDVYLGKTQNLPKILFKKFL